MAVLLDYHPFLALICLLVLGLGRLFARVTSCAGVDCNPFFLRFPESLSPLLCVRTAE